MGAEWNVTVAVLVACGVAAACSGDSDEAKGPGGGGGAGGSEAGAPEATAPDAAGGTVGAGGAAGTGGSIATGGTSSTGGSGGTPAPDGSAGSGPAFTCDPSGAGLDDCGRCLAAKCCQEVSECGTNHECGDGQGTGTEFECVAACVTASVKDGGAAAQSAIDTCAAGCAHDGPPNAISAFAEALIACTRAAPEGDAGAPDGGIEAGARATNCALECFGAE